MKPPEVKRALEIVEDALELGGRELELYLDSVCGENSPLRREVLSYLDYDAQTVFATQLNGGSAPAIPSSTTNESRYDLGDEIARGGMGVVLRAFDNNLRRNVAVKVLKKEAGNDPDIVRRFLLEAHLGGQLQHPGIAPVYEIGQLPDSRPFIAMKLVNGATLEHLLKQRVEKGDADQTKFLSIFNQVCQAIAFAHTRGVIHRDLKPANVMVGEFGEVQVMDWGIAKLLGDDHSDVGESPTEVPSKIAVTAGEDPIHEATTRVDLVQVDTDAVAQQTRIGQVMGTPAYMPPEQYIGRAEKTSDVFALGAILCEILTGEPTADDLDAASDRLDRCQCDQELAELANDCIQRNSVDRPTDAGIVATRISDYLNAIQQRLNESEIATARAAVKAEEQKRGARFKLFAAGIGFALILSGMITYFQLRFRYAEQISNVQTTEREAAEEVSYWATMLAAFREFRAGNHYEAKRILDRSPERLRNWEWHYVHGAIDSSTWEIEVPGRQIDFAVFIEGGTQVALIDESSRTQIVDTASGAFVRDVPSPTGRPVAVGNEGKYVLTVTNSKDTDPDKEAVARVLILWETSTGDPVQRFEFPSWQNDPSKSAWARSRFVVSPSGSHVACPSATNEGEVALYETDSGRLVRNFRAGVGVTISPDGHWFVYQWDSKIRFWDVREEREARPPIPIRAGKEGGHVKFLKCSPSRSRLAAIRNTSITVWDLATDEVVELALQRVEGAGEPILFSEDAAHFVAAFHDGPVKVWDAHSGELQLQVGINASVTTKLGAYSWRDGQLLVPSHDERGSHIKLWDLRPMRRTVLANHRNFVYPVAISENGKRIVSGAWDKTVRIWNAETGSEEFKCEGHDLYLHDLDLDDEGERIVSIDLSLHVCLWDATTGELLATRRFANTNGSRADRRIVFAKNGQSVFAKTDSDLLELNGSDLKTIRSIPLQETFGSQKVQEIEVLSGGTQLGILIEYSETTSKFKILDMQTLRDERSIDLLGQGKTFSVSPDQKRVALGFKDGTIEMWDLSKPEKLIWSRSHQEGEVFSVAFTPDGSRLFSGGRDSTIRIWDTATGEEFGPLLGHENYVYCLDISGDGTRLVSGSGDRTVRIWEAPLSRKPADAGGKVASKKSAASNIIFRIKK